MHGCVGVWVCVKSWIGSARVLPRCSLPTLQTESARRVWLRLAVAVIRCACACTALLTVWCATDPIVVAIAIVGYHCDCYCDCRLSIAVVGCRLRCDCRLRLPAGCRLKLQARGEPACYSVTEGVDCEAASQTYVLWARAGVDAIKYFGLSGTGRY